MGDGVDERYDKTEGQYQWGVLATDGPGSNLCGG